MCGASIARTAVLSFLWSHRRKCIQSVPRMGKKRPEAGDLCFPPYHAVAVAKAVTSIFFSFLVFLPSLTSEKGQGTRSVRNVLDEKLLVSLVARVVKM